MPNHWTKAKETGIPYVMTDKTRKKLSESVSRSNLKRWSNEENRKKHSVAMKKAVERNPDSYTSSNRGRTKQILFDGIKFQGKWELKFYIFCKTNNIYIVRSNEWFEYEWNGTRKYFPDFYLPDLQMYVEVKGYETERDKAKWQSFPNKLLVVRKEDIAKIDKNVYTLPGL